MHLYNALLEIALFRKEVGPVSVFLSELEEKKVVPDSHTLALLLRTVPTDELGSLIETFRKKFRVKPTDEALLVLLERLAEQGDAEGALRAFKASKTLQEREEAWCSLIVAHAKGGAARVRECGALLENMVEYGHVPDVKLFSKFLFQLFLSRGGFFFDERKDVALNATATVFKDGPPSNLDRILALMKKMRVVSALLVLFFPFNFGLCRFLRWRLLMLLIPYFSNRSSGVRKIEFSPLLWPRRWWV